MLFSAFHLGCPAPQKIAQLVAPVNRHATRMIPFETHLSRYASLPLVPCPRLFLLGLVCEIHRTNSWHRGIVEFHFTVFGGRLMDRLRRRKHVVYCSAVSCNTLAESDMCVTGCVKSMRNDLECPARSWKYKWLSLVPVFSEKLCDLNWISQIWMNYDRTNISIMNALFNLLWYQILDSF